MTHIVLAYDASAGAESALRWVVWRTAGDDAVVDLLHVSNPLWADKTRAGSLLRDARERLRHVNPRLTVHAIERDGRRGPNLLRGAAEADLIVMGVARPDGRVRPGGGWLPLRLASRLICATCLVPEGWTHDDVGSRVVVGVDDDPSSDTAVAFAADEATRLGLPLHLVHAWQTMPGSPARRDDTVFDTSDIDAAHRRLLGAVAARVRSYRPGLPLELTMVHDNPVSTLAVASTHACVTVIGSHHRGVIAAGFFGSTARDVARDLRAPVVIVP